MSHTNELRNILLRSISYTSLLSPLNPLHLVIGVLSILKASRARITLEKILLVLYTLAVIVFTILDPLIIPIVGIVASASLFLMDSKRVSKEYFIYCITQIIPLIIMLRGTTNIQKFVVETYIWSLTNIQYYVHISLYIVFVFFIASYEALRLLFRNNALKAAFLSIPILVLVLILLSFILYLTGFNVAYMKLSIITQCILISSLLIIIVYVKLKNLI